MRKANSTYKVFLAFTLIFILIAGFSFAAFRETEELCQSESKKCCQQTTSERGGEMLWDSFSRRFVSLVTIK